MRLEFNAAKGEKDIHIDFLFFTDIASQSLRFIVLFQFGNLNVNLAMLVVFLGSYIYGP